MLQDMGDISAGYSPTTVPTVTEVPVSEGTHHAPHPATAKACTTLHLMDAPLPPSP